MNENKQQKKMKNQQKQTNKKSNNNFEAMFTSKFLSKNTIAFHFLLKIPPKKSRPPFPPAHYYTLAYSNSLSAWHLFCFSASTSSSSSSTNLSNPLSRKNVAAGLYLAVVQYFPTVVSLLPMHVSCICLPSFIPQKHPLSLTFALFFSSFPVLFALTINHHHPLAHTLSCGPVT